MNAFMMSSQYITVFWSMFGLTSIHFDEKVNCTFAHGLDSRGNKLIQIKYERGGKTISLAPLRDFDTNFNCYTENDEMYFFNIKHSEKLFSKNIRVKKASQFRGGKLVYKDSKVKIFDSGNNYFIKNLTNLKMSVNETFIDKEGITSKWIPVEINGKLIRF